MSGTLFQHRGEWKYSRPSASGFVHHFVGRLTGLPTRELAEQRVLELIERGTIPA